MKTIFCTGVASLIIFLNVAVGMPVANTHEVDSNHTANELSIGGFSVISVRVGLLPETSSKTK